MKLFIIKSVDFILYLLPDGLKQVNFVNFYLILNLSKTAKLVGLVEKVKSTSEVGIGSYLLVFIYFYSEECIQAHTG